MAFRKNNPGTPTQSRTNENVRSGADRIREMIDAEQEKADQQYLQIGRLYASSHPTDYEEKFAPMLSAVQIFQKKINAYRLQLQILKGNMQCPACGKEVPSGSAFCKHCGTKIPSLDMSQFTKCPRCGKPVLKDMKDCVFCGSSMTAADSRLKCAQCGAPLETGERFCRSCGAAATPPKSGQTSKRKCPRCGAALSNDVLFCTECGLKL